MKRLMSLLLITALTACATSASPPPPDSPRGEGEVVNETAGLSAYPSSSGTEVIPDGEDTRTRFQTDASLDEVYSHFHGELTAQGWQRTSLERDDEVEAGYAREGRTLEFELESDDGGFELEIDIDSDNDSYDEDDDDGDDGDDGDDQDD